MIYDETHMVLAEGNYVLAVSEGTYGGEATSYYDLWRVEKRKNHRALGCDGNNCARRYLG